MFQFFIDKDLNVNDVCEFEKDDEHHIKNVLRLNKDEVIRLICSGKAYLAKIQYSNFKPYALIFEKDNVQHELDIKITLIQALIKNDKFELILQKTCELGVSDIVPMISRFVNAKSDIIENKSSRYNKILVESSKQCKREKIANLKETIKLQDCLKYKSDINLFAYETDFEKTDNISRFIEKGKDITIIIGCEGGFSSDEASFLKENGFIPINLGKRILRAETAAIYTLSVISSINEVN